MNRITSIGLTLAAGLALGACQHDSNRMSSNDTYSENDRARMNDGRTNYDNRNYDSRNSADGRTNYENRTNSDNRSNYDDRSTAANRNYNDRNTADDRANYNNRNTADNRNYNDNTDASRNPGVDPNAASSSSTGYDPNYINRPRDTATDASGNQYTDNRNTRGTDNRTIHGTDRRPVDGDTDRYSNNRYTDQPRDRKWRDDSRYHAQDLGWRSAARNSTDVATIDERTMYWYDDMYNRASPKNQSWHHQHVVSMNESELPQAVKSGLSKDADGATLSETGRLTWEGQQAYTACVMKQGRKYQVITDTNGELLAMRRLD